MSKQRQNLSSAAAAYLRGQEARPDSLFWLQRAHRLAPEDPRIHLDLARKELTLAAAEPQAIYKRFQLLASQHDIASIWVGLAITAQLCRDAAGAATALDNLLSRHCLPDDSYFPEFATKIARAAGYDGWQGITAKGETQSFGHGRLLGAYPDMAALTRVYGLVDCDKTGLKGWAVRPARPESPPALTLTDATGQTRPVACGRPLPNDETAPFLPRYRFHIAARHLAGLKPPFEITGPDGKNLLGSPLDPRLLNLPPVVAASRGTAPQQCPPRAPLALIMPVYGGVEETKASILSVLRNLPAATRLLVVNDCAPAPTLVHWLSQLADQGRIELYHHTQNLGFCAAVNTGLQAAKDCDVVLLNSDILMSKTALQTMRELAYTHPAIGTITPLSNAATICSYPDMHHPNPMPDLAQTDNLDQLARQTNQLAFVEIPTGVGFCLYIRHDCLHKTGLLRGEIFAQGYGEENDFCLRARHLGYLNVLAVGAYVAHRGNVSFKGAALALGRRNSARLERLFPGYAALVRAHYAQDPAASYRKALDTARLCQQAGKCPAVLLISHALSGGVSKQLETAVSAYRAKGMLPLVLTPKRPDSKPPKYPWPAWLNVGDDQTYPNLVFTLPADLPALLALLNSLRVCKIERHHMLGHHPMVRELAALLGVPQVLIAHDYASFCPRVTLLHRAQPESPLRYCGEPDIDGCVSCYRQSKDGVFESLPINKLLARSRAEFAASTEVVVPSQDMARRLTRHFPGLHPIVSPWEDDSRLFKLRPPRQGARRIGVIGGIGPAKGYDVVLACALDAKARKLPLEFVIIGTTTDDEPFLQEDIMVTGAYKADELPALVQIHAVDLAFLPSICPETWGFVLSEAWQCGLYTVVFDLGAQAERVRATNRGSLLPLGLPPEFINNFLMSVEYPPP